jgi:hypothetical protein
MDEPTNYPNLCDAIADTFYYSMDPILKRGATAWERAFQRRLPQALSVYTKDAGKVLSSFHDKIEERAHQNGVGLANLAILKGSIHTYEMMFETLSTELLAMMQEAQKDANRDFVPTIANLMLTAYELCTDESGPGSFMRMKNHMITHVEHSRHHMFTSATKTVEAHLAQMCRGLEEKMANRSDEIFAMMRADYMQVLGGIQVSQHAISKEENSMKTEIKTILNKVESQFEQVLNGELDEQEREASKMHIDDPDADKPLQLDGDGDDDDDSVIGSTREPDIDVSMQDAVNRDSVYYPPTVEDASDEEL